MSAELKPCPFCGSPADDFNPDGEHEGYRINCSGDQQFMHADSTSCPINTFGYSTYEDAKTAWNHRAQPAEEVQPVAVVQVGGWEMTNSLEWCKDYGLDRLEPGTQLYTRPPAAGEDRLDADHVLAHGYRGGTASSNKDGTITIQLHYANNSQGEAAFERITEIIDAALAVSKEKKE